MNEIKPVVGLLGQLLDNEDQLCVACSGLIDYKMYSTIVVLLLLLLLATTLIMQLNNNQWH